MNVQNPKGMKPGEARCPGPSARDVILGDVTPTPAALTEESYTFLGDEDISYDRYTSADFLQREMDQMWTRVWQWVCREEDIPESGDHIVYDIGLYSFIIARQEDGSVKAFYNSCLHRGTQLRPTGAEGNADHFRCPYHGWTWSLDGTLTDLPCEWDFPHVDQEEFELPEVQVDHWNGFVFINMDLDCAPLEDYLGVLPEHFANWRIDNRVAVARTEKILPSNWKASQEAFLEAYHILGTHPQALPYAGDANAQYDTFGDHVSRFVQLLGSPSPHMADRITEDDILEQMGGYPAGSTVPEGTTARHMIAENMRKAVGEECGVDLSGYSDSETLDSIEYFVFPNMFVFPGINISVVYRFRPNGMDPDSSIMDLMLMKPVPEEGPRPEPADVVKLDVWDSYTTVPALGGLGGVYDQDTANLDMQQKGFKAAKKRGQTLGNYQEVRTRHMHQVLDKYMAD